MSQVIRHLWSDSSHHTSVFPAESPVKWILMCLIQFANEQGAHHHTIWYLGHSTPATRTGGKKSPVAGKQSREWIKTRFNICRGWQACKHCQHRLHQPSTRHGQWRGRHHLNWATITDYPACWELYYLNIYILYYIYLYSEYFLISNLYHMQILP